MVFLSYMKPSMQSYSNFCKYESAIDCCFRIVFGFDLGKDAFIK